MANNDNNKTTANENGSDDDDVMASAAKNVSDQVAPLKKRFYKTVAVAIDDDGYGITLDDRPIRTPSRKTLSFPTRPLADAVADEWSAQITEVNPVLMPLTRMANTVIDGVAVNHGDVAEDVARFAMTDLLCYRVTEPVELVERQKETWDPVLRWAEDAFAVRFELASGVMPVTQDAAIEAVVVEHLAKVSAFELGPLHVMTTMTGSALLALGVQAGAHSAQAAWDAAHLDEDWQISQWGDDEEASERRAMRRLEMLSAARFMSLSSD